MDDPVRRAEERMEERMRARAEGEAREAAPPSDEAELVEQIKRDLQRERADFANYRRRNEADRAEFARFAKADLITRLLEVLDDLDRALAAVPEDLRGRPWVEGIGHVERKLRDVLAAEGLEEVGVVGEPFDPRVHEAIAHVESTAPEGTVVDEVRKAYRLHDKVIRPALVTVAKAASLAREGGERGTRPGGKEHDNG